MVIGSRSHGFRKENLEVKEALSVRIAPEDAKNRIFVGDIRDEDGRLIDPARLEVVSADIDFYHPDSDFVFGISYGPGSIDVISRLSDISSSFRIGLDVLAADKAAPSEHLVDFVLDRGLEDGVSASVPLQLDFRSAGKVTLRYADADALAQGVEFWPIAGQLSFHNPFFAGFLHGEPVGPYWTPFKATMYAENLKFRSGERVAGFMVTRPNARRFADFTNAVLLETGPIGFIDNQSYIKFDGRLGGEGSRVTYTQAGHELPVAQGPMYFATHGVYDKPENVYVTVNSALCSLGCRGFLKDLRHNLFTESIDYKIRCDGEPVAEGQTRVMHFNRLGRTCGKIDVAYTMPTRLFDRHDTSTVEITLISESLPESRSVDAPMLDELMLTSDGRLSRVLDGDAPQVSVKVSADYARTGKGRPLVVSLEYRLDDTASWTPLEMTAQGEGAFQGQLPVLDGAHVGSLRLRIADEQGNSQEQTLNSLFLIGRDARSLAGTVPQFGVLPDLKVQASGPLTPFTLPAVLARDPVDGDLVAATDSKGPYAPGRHSIRWTAVNSADVLGSAIQTLNVVDITPPQVTPPSDVVVQASGLFTPVDLGQAVAVDQEDGTLAALPNRPGPFGVGTHLVTWTATDRAGNMGRATQTVTIVGDAPPVQGISSAMEADAEDIALAGLPDLPDARFAGTPLVAPVVISATRGVDDSPSLPYDALSDGELWMSVTVPATPEEGAREYLLLAVAESATAQELHLFVGEDLDGDGPELAEQRCANKTAAKPQVCETRIAREAGAPESTYWVLAQNIRSGLGNADSIFLRAAAVPLLPENKALVVTGPGHVTADRMFTYRVAWDDPDWLPGEERVGYVLVYATPDELAYYEPLWLKRGSATSAAHMLTPGVPRTLSLAPGQAQDRLYVDIPANTTAVTFRSSGSDEVDLYAAHVPDPAGPGIAPAPARDLAQYVSQTAGGEQAITLEGSEVLPGRWYLTPVNRGSGNARVSVGASIDSREAAPPLRPGHYFDPARSGQGVFLDFAGDQWAMVWYAYLEDGTPTWYFAQAAAPGSDQAQWSAPLYRVAWNGFTTHATVVGNVNLTILPGPVEASPKLTMSFNLDGVSGSEPMTQLGDDNCPSFGGVPLDATGHWYSPERPGFGYSVQFQLHTEFHAAYVYDDLGYPRWLIGQKDLDTGDVDVPLLQVSGFCPTCQAVTPTTTGVGVLKRFLASASNNDGKPGLIHMDVDARFAPPLSGEWRQSLPVFMLTYRNGCK